MPTLREMTGSDVPAVCGLLRELGYELTEGEIARRLRDVDRHPDHLALVLEDDDGEDGGEDGGEQEGGGPIVAFLHMFDRPAIEKPREAIVQALVVTEARRGAGLGQAMMEWVETWARDRGLTSIALSTQTHRGDAQVFYHRLGYRTAAESRLLRKHLTPE